MSKFSIFLISLFSLALQTCTPSRTRVSTLGVFESPDQQKTIQYTDDEVELLIQQFPFLSASARGTRSPEDALEQLGIDTDTLELIAHGVGGCYDEMMYDLSLSYWLLVDRNVCSGLRVWVELKDASD